MKKPAASTSTAKKASTSAGASAKSGKVVKTAGVARPQPATPVKAQAAEAGVVTKAKPADKAKAGKAGKREKVVRDSFSLPKHEHAQLKQLRADLLKAGRESTKSELLRAGLSLLATRGKGELLALLNALPVVPKGKSKK
ncbi:hypothetical protein [Azoarcus indigens]|uniref:hypothetical protein n=1 Tax=Azoarcus indigens TaxID=29545 RepID=UPI00105DE3D4|nr:hypothetical protein [Azoarcus indigens]